KLSQSELAVALGVTRQTIISLEKEKYTASLELAFKIARYFDKQIEEVFIYTESEGG
ncbi:helix-turn-helix transcriptional regulator, partial [Streptococcus agalactiae]